MKLEKWLKREEMSVAAFAGRVGVVRTSTHRYINGDRVPDRSVAKKIVALTKGAVTLQDLYA